MVSEAFAVDFTVLPINRMNVVHEYVCLDTIVGVNDYGLLVVTIL